MLEYQRLVDNIRLSLSASGPEKVELCRNAAAEFLLVVDQVNERLRKCEAFLRKGLRSEAIQFCEIEPNLLDVVAALDFPERDAWCGVLAQFGIVAPPPLLIEIAAELNEAYAIEQPMQVLLAKHRLLNLARAPVKQRLAVVRGLATSDPNPNAKWKSDQQPLEEQRRREIKHELTGALELHNDAALTTLEQELKESGWTAPPFDAFLRQIAETRAARVRSQARLELEQLEARLHEAHGSFDVAAGRSLRDQWQPLARRAGIAGDDPLCAGTAPIFSWLADEDRREQAEQDHANAIAALEQDLNSRAAAGALAASYETAAAFGEIPPDLEDRYHDRVARLRRGAVMRAWLLAGAAVATTVVLVALAGFAVVQFRHRKDVLAHAAALGTLVDEANVGDAESYLDQLTRVAPAVAASPEIVSLQERLTALKSAEAERVAQFNAAFEQASAEGAARPNVAAWESARKLAATTAERERIARFEEEVSAEAARAQDALNAAYSVALDGFSKQVSALEANSPESAAAARHATAAQLESEILRHDQKTVGVTASLREKSKELVRRVAAVKTAIEQSEQELAMTADVARAIGNSPRYLEALNQYVAKFPRAAKALDYQKVALERPLWDVVQQWNEMAPQWRKTPLTDLTPDRAKQLVARTEAVLEKCGTYPEAAMLRERLPHLKAIAQRQDANTGERLDAQLKRVFDAPLMAGAWLVERKDGRRYYLQSKPVLDKKFNSFPHVIGFDLAERRASIAAADIVFEGPAPQTGVAAAARKALAALDDKSWEKGMYDVLKAVVNEPKLDPLLKLDLLKQSLEVASRGSRPLDKAFQPHRDSIANARVNLLANWLDPEDAEVDKQRRQAQFVIERFPDLGSAGIDAARELATFRDGMATVYRWVGALERDSAEAWRCATNPGVRDSGKLFVIVPSQSSSELVPVGQLEEGKAELDSGMSSVLLEGRPVFLALR